ncbi:MAG: thioredoxin family protein [Gemmatimonadetes bacterium]|nr:thioredoxin family protein [Gemmatimonadota bacterium]
MAPIVHGLESEWKARVEFLYVNVADSSTRSLRERLGFVSTPHFFFLFDSGVVRRQFRGVVSRDSLIASLRAIAAEPPS